MVSAAAALPCVDTALLTVHALSEHAAEHAQHYAVDNCFQLAMSARQAGRHASQLVTH